LKDKTGKKISTYKKFQSKKNKEKNWKMNIKKLITEIISNKINKNKKIKINLK
jgi:hypothetical protein